MLVLKSRSREKRRSEKKAKGHPIRRLKFI